MSKITINGGMTAQYMWATNKILTESEINAIISNSSKPEWDEHTIALATFENSIGASNTPIIEQDIIGYRIMKKRHSDNVLQKVAEVEPTYKMIKDYMVKNNDEYEYYIYPLLQDEGVNMIGSPIISSTIKPSWQDWVVYGTFATDIKGQYIIDLNNVWRFGLNIESGVRKQTFDKSQYNNRGKYGKFGVGEKNHTSSTLSCLLGHISCESLRYIDTEEMIEKWNDFAGNGEIKIIKNRKGMIMPIEIVESEFLCDDSFGEIPSTLSFSYVQVAEYKDICVYGTVM